MNVEKIETPEQCGRLVTYYIDDYGMAQPFFTPDDGVLDTEVQRRQSRSRMPAEYAYKKPADFRWNDYGENMDSQKKILNAFITNYTEWQRFGRGLYLYSKTKGSGKTLMACCIGNELIRRRGISVKFVMAQEYIELIRDNTDEGREIIKSIKECDLLILDDIGAEHSGKEWVNDVIFSLVNHRDSRNYTTIYTSNFSLDDLKEDERTVDRIIGHSIPVPFPEISIRRKQAREQAKKFINKALENENSEVVF